MALSGIMIWFSIFACSTNAFPMGSLWLQKNEKLDDKSLVSRLTKAEKNLMFPGFTYFKDANYMVVSTNKDKRSHVTNQSYNLTLTGDGKDFNFEMKNSESVPIAESLRTTYQSIMSISHCVYSGDSYMNDTKINASQIKHGLVTVNLCNTDEIHGEIMNSGETWKFYALPKRLQGKRSNVIKLVMVYINSNGDWLQSFATRCGVESSNLSPFHKENEIVQSENKLKGKNEWWTMEAAENYHGVRKRRQSRTHIIQLALFIDIQMFQAFNQNEERLIDSVVLNINSVQLILSQQELVPNIRLHLVDILMLSSSDSFTQLEENDNAEQYLTNFGAHQATLNPFDIRDNRHWDHAILLSGNNLVSLNSGTAILGISYLEGMCDPTESVSLVEGNHPLVSTIIAHEIGHSIGSDHDGFNNICAGGIMSSVLGPDERQYRWSECSNSMIEQFLSSNSRAGCLLEP